MKISRKLYDKIFTQIGEEPPEIGGILGGVKDEITVVEFDECKTRKRLCSYTPNVEYLNTIIDLWEKEQIEFLGIFHSHYFGVKTLSEGDKKYICTIIKSMPNDISQLYFPIAVMPDKNFIVYKAYKCKGDVVIEREKFEIVE